MLISKAASDTTGRPPHERPGPLHAATPVGCVVVLVRPNAAGRGATAHQIVCAALPCSRSSPSPRTQSRSTLWEKLPYVADTHRFGR